jgi:hypothetical protein
MSGKKQSGFPFGLEDRMGCITYPIIAVEETFRAVRVVHRVMFPEQRVVDYTILREYISSDREASQKESTIYYVSCAPKHPVLKTHIDSLRRLALEVGATPEAVRLLGSLEPWSKKEEAIMAEKLKAKAKPVKASTDELKAAAKQTPVVKGAKAPPGTKTPARKGNADALAKARAARAERGPDNRKVKANIKPKDIAARAGSYRHTMLTNLLNAKTVQEFRDKGHTAGDLAYAVKAGIVSV